jgi:hypothetical protein
MHQLVLYSYGYCLYICNITRTISHGSLRYTLLPSLSLSLSLSLLTSVLLLPTAPSVLLDPLSNRSAVPDARFAPQ